MRQFLSHFLDRYLQKALFAIILLEIFFWCPMTKQTAKKPQLFESIAVYMSVAPIEAIEQSLEIIKNLPLPGSKTVAKKKTGNILKTSHLLLNE